MFIVSGRLPSPPVGPRLRAMTRLPQGATDPERTRILVVDADHRVRDSLAGLIALADGLEVVGTASHIEAAIEAVEALVPDLVLLDPNLPDREVGSALLDRLRGGTRRPRVFIMSWASAAESAELVARADGFIEKCADPSIFADAVLVAARSARHGTDRPSPHASPETGPAEGASSPGISTDAPVTRAGRRAHGDAQVPS